MGGKDIYDDDVVIADTFTIAKRTHPQRIAVERAVITPSNVRAHVSWGMAPTDTASVLFSLAQGTLWLSDSAAIDHMSMLKSMQREYSEALTMEANGTSFHVSTHHSLDDDVSGGVYHILLPPLFVPLVVRAGQSTKIVNAKKTPSRRLALTWLFKGVLDLQLRFDLADERKFEKLRAEDIGLPAVGSSALSDLAHEASKLPTNPQAWRVILDLLKGTIS